MESTLFEAVDSFLSIRFSKEDAALKAVGKSLRLAGIKNISVSASQGKLLYLLAILCRASRILEIGTLGGYSTIWMGRALPTGGRLLSMEFNPDHAKIARKNIARAGLSSVVEVREGKALRLLPSLVKEKEPPFDMVFLDADRASLTKYFHWALKLTHQGSVIVADNVVRQGRILESNSKDESVIGVKAFLRKLSASKDVESAVFQTVGTKGHDGMAIAIVKKG